MEGGLSASSKHRGASGGEGQGRPRGRGGPAPWDPLPRLPAAPSRLSRAAAVTPSGGGGKCKRLSLGSRCYKVRASRGSHSWLRAGTPRGEGLALQTARRGTSPSPPPVSSPAVARALGDPARLQCPEGRGGAQRRRWAVTLSSFTSGSCSGCEGRVPGLGEEGGHTARRGPALRTPSKGWVFTPGVSRDPRLPSFSVPPPRPMGSTPLSPELPLLPSSSRLRGGCRPPERPRAAWAAGGASCEAAGRGLGCGLLRRRAVSQKCRCPSPHTPLNSHLAPHSFPHSTRPSLSSPRHPQPGNLASESTKS